MSCCWVALRPLPFFHRPNCSKLGRPRRLETERPKGGRVRRTTIGSLLPQDRKRLPHVLKNHQRIKLPGLQMSDPLDHTGNVDEDEWDQLDDSGMDVDEELDQPDDSGMDVDGYEHM